MTSEQLYLKVLSFINQKRSIKNLKDFDCFIKEWIEEQEIENLLYDLHKWGRIRWIDFYSNGYDILDESIWITLNARWLQMINELEKKLEVKNYIHNSWTIWNIWNNNWSIIIHSTNEANELINKIITELENSNIIDKDILVEELKNSHKSNNKQSIISTLWKILSVSSHISSIWQFVIALLQYFNS